MDTDGNGQAIEFVMNSLGDCETACKAIKQCQHFVYITANNTCKLYRAVYVQTTVKEATLGVATCPILSITPSATSCQKLCFKIDNCKAVVFTGYSCKMYTRLMGSMNCQGSTMYIKKPSGRSHLEWDISISWFSKFYVY
ncbi:hypothetical protein Btru_074540 [Bulinus truncatus]|nr:hypothetical protein Btru_074540 [Bulinus truncatus]